MSSTPFLDFLKLIDKDAALRKKLYDQVVGVFKEYHLTREHVRVLLSGHTDSIYIEVKDEWERAHGRGPGDNDVSYGPLPMHTIPPHIWGIGSGEGP